MTRFSLAAAAGALALFVSLSPNPLAAQRDFPAGRVVERVAARADTAQRYALYLPSAYTADRAWPVVFLMDPRGRATEALERMRPAAERLGYVLLSSYNTASDVATSPNGAALEAMLDDAQDRLNVDTRRIYLAGFSGTAREAWTLGLRLGGHTAGVIGFGAGFPGENAVFQLRAAREAPFAFFGGAGTLDFNYEEVRALDGKLEMLGVPRRIAFYEGEHAWPPAAVFTEALEWMTLRAMRTGRARRDDAWTDSLLARRTGEARALEGAGKLAEALARWRAVAEDFGGGLRDGAAAEAQAKVAELERAAPVRRALAEQARLSQRDSAHARRFAEFVRTYGEGPRPPAHGRVAGDLQVERLRREAADTAELPRSLSARRLLENVFVYASFYGPDTYLARGDTDRALALLRLAGEAKPGTPQLCWATARVQARIGNAGEALAALECAAASGLLAAAAVEAEPAFAPLRDMPAFRAVVERLRAAGPPARP